MKNPRRQKELEKKVLLQETQIRHLANELHLTKEEYEASKRDYLEMVSNLEKKVDERSKRVTELRDRVARTEKMEALGILAGGVAHDLNNVLVGLVTYPELLLLKVPQDSPLRKPLLTVQKSGEKAAAIVRDLLTLTRRGVLSFGVGNLNRIVAEYLESPECERLRFYHPKIEIETKLEANLPNILGSPVHLSKTVMNLVSNAAEAMPDGGRVLISTGASYVDRTIQAYNDVQKGDYVTLSVSDNGVGISSEDMKRIFEPFYTKKVMGRSGTGLGMAVVWGTLMDHKGHIDVQSEEGKGTTFTLYFPSSPEELIRVESSSSAVGYMGREESILIVDDMKEQREIATKILEKLRYRVSSVASGEDAIDCLKTRSADLVVLDMIMDPGIDGFETYKRILEFHPQQRAILVSGFSETERVKKAQRLGAGAYVKKPYSMEEIGQAIRGELDK